MTVITPTRLELWFVDWKRQVWTACGDCGTVTSFTKCWSPDGRHLLLSRKDTLSRTRSTDRDQTWSWSARRVAALILRSGLPMAGSSPIVKSRREDGLRNQATDPRAHVGRIVVPLGL